MEKDRMVVICLAVLRQVVENANRGVIGCPPAILVSKLGLNPEEQSVFTNEKPPITRAEVEHLFESLGHFDQIEALQMLAQMRGRSSAQVSGK